MRRVLGAGMLLVLGACMDRDREVSDTTTAVSVTGATADAAQPAPMTSAGLLDPNSATPEQLAALPGMDSAKVAILLRGRPFADMLAVDRALAPAMPDAQRKALYARLWKPIDLNTAKGEEILLIPGVGPRMRHEFEEYRPYLSMEQFRREIGKYVDKQELARLEQYVSVK